MRGAAEGTPRGHGALRGPSVRGHCLRGCSGRRQPRRGGSLATRVAARPRGRLGWRVGASRAHRTQLWKGRARGSQGGPHACGGAQRELYRFPPAEGSRLFRFKAHARAADRHRDRREGCQRTLQWNAAPCGAAPATASSAKARDGRGRFGRSGRRRRSDRGARRSDRGARRRAGDANRRVGGRRSGRR